MGQAIDSKTVHSSLMRSCFVSEFAKSALYDFIKLMNMQADTGAPFSVNKPCFRSWP
jgi:hypothetical protein